MMRALLTARFGRASLALASAFMITCGCRSSTETPTAALSNDQQEDTRQRVIEWLNKIDFAQEDSPYAPSLSTQPSYEVWLDEGRRFIGHAEITALDTLFRQGDSHIDRAQIAYVLGWVGNRQSVENLMEAIGDANANVRIEVVASLGRLGDARAVTGLCEAALKDTNANVRANAASSLSRFPTQASRGCLRKALDDESPFVRQMARRSIDLLDRSGATESVK
jgi:hypothetical protein